MALMAGRDKKEASSMALGDSPLLPESPHSWAWARNPPPRALTVVADRASIGSHGAVTGEAVPLLQANALVGTGLFGAGGAGAWKRQEEGTPPAQPSPFPPRRCGSFRARRKVLLSTLPDWKGQILTGHGGRGVDGCSGTARLGLEL